MARTYTVTCANCGKEFQKSVREMNKGIKEGYKYHICSRKCLDQHHHKIGTINVKCGNCGKPLSKTLAEYKSSKSGEAFCNHSCSATYQNTHKTTGCRRSKLEIWLEQKLNELYPQLTILYCDKTTINSELDIFVPSLMLAFELNGIYHYEPIHGSDKLAQIQNNDQRKYQACLEHQIELCIIDSTSLKYFKEHKAQEFLDIITQIINSKL